MLGPWAGASAVQAHETKPQAIGRRMLLPFVKWQENKACQAMGTGDAKAGSEEKLVSPGAGSLVGKEGMCESREGE